MLNNVTPATATAAAKPARKLTTRNAKPAATPAKPVAAKPAKPVAKPEAAKPSANVTRTASTIAAGACNFGTLSDRDTAYLAFYASLAKAATNGVVTLRAIVDSGRGPAYNGSAKPHDAGVVQRLAKADLITIRDNGAAFVFTTKAKTLKAYASA